MSCGADNPARGLAEALDPEFPPVSTNQDIGAQLFYDTAKEANALKVLKGVVPIVEMSALDKSFKILNNDKERALIYVRDNTSGEREIRYYSKEKESIVEILSRDDSIIFNNSIYVILSILGEPLKGLYRIDDNGIVRIDDVADTSSIIVFKDKLYYSGLGDNIELSSIDNQGKKELVREYNADVVYISSFSIFNDKLTYRLRDSSTQTVIDSLDSFEILAKPNGSPVTLLAEVGNVRIVYDTSFGTPGSKLINNIGEDLLLDVPRTIANSSRFFFAKEKFNDNFGSFYELNDDGSVSEFINTFLDKKIKYLSYRQVTYQDITYMIAYLEDDTEHIISFNSINKTITRVKEVDSSVTLIMHNGIPHFTKHTSLQGASGVELYSFDNKFIRLLYIDIDT